MVQKDNIEKAKKSIFKVSEEPQGLKVKGYDFENEFDLEKFLKQYGSTGFQATHFHKGFEILKKMFIEKKKTGKDMTIFLGYTSNMVSSGVREAIKFLVKHNMVDCIVTTAGGVEEDIIKCIKPFILGDFRAKGAMLRQKGINRIGNIFVPNDRYCDFEDFMVPILKELYESQEKEGKITRPSELIRILGEKINNEDSIYYWAAKNKIPVFCPALTDGSIGDMIFFFKYKHPEFRVDMADDNFQLNELAIEAKKTGVLVLGAGVVKHQILNANMMREGTAYAVYINTAPEYDGSDSGAEPEEAISWGKISQDAGHVKVVGDATILFPLMVAGLQKIIESG
ncbi:deoxyhypusine synthase [Candidatus Woesearchaeota archaeon]|nr:deoxyhypusine synthase [Candidatus Woesearchaeota archaeon]